MKLDVIHPNKIAGLSPSSQVRQSAFYDFSFPACGNHICLVGFCGFARSVEPCGVGNVGLIGTLKDKLNGVNGGKHDFFSPLSMSVYIIPCGCAVVNM